MNLGLGEGTEIWIIVTAVVTFLIATVWGFKKASRKEIPFEDKTKLPPLEKEVPAPTAPTAPPALEPAKVPVEVKIPWVSRLQKGLSRSRQEIWGKLEKIVSGDKSALTTQQLEAMEEVLYSADMAPTLVTELIQEIGQKSDKGFQIGDLKNLLYQFLLGKMEPVQKQTPEEIYQFHPDNLGQKGKTRVIMIVGVNGGGKTTTIGKLATKLTRQGAKVVVGACDTFRAAAVDQLEIWCQRAGAEMIRAKEGADPSGVAFDTLKKAQEMGADYCLLDTAGRIHTNANLMEELKKGKRVLSKLDESAPHHILLIIDAVTGQNALKQAREFHKALGVTGIIFTKCDGSAKAGNAVSIVQDLGIPISYIGVGEEVEDLDIFNVKEYLRALLDLEESATP